MARCRTEFVFGKLIDRGDEIEKSENIKSIQKQLENFGLKTPFIEGEKILRTSTKINRSFDAKKTLRS